jgi:hypothetical protein
MTHLDLDIADDWREKHFEPRRRDTLIRKIGELGANSMTDNDRSIEWDSDLDQFYVPYDPHSQAKVAAGCGDERRATPETITMINADIRGNIERDGYARWFGGLAGAAEVFALALVAQHGIGALAHYGESFGDVMAFVDERLRERTNLALYNHRGCAFIQSEGIITYKAGHDTRVLERSRRHQDDFFGENDQHFNRIIMGASTIAAVYGSDPVDKNGVTMPKDLGINEDNMSLSRDPMQLEGHHLKLDETQIALNYMPCTMSNLLHMWQPETRGGLGKGLFNGDPIILAESLIKGVPEAQFDPEVLLRTIDHLAVVTGNELEDHLGGELYIARRGDAEQAIDYLQTVATAVQLQPSSFSTSSKTGHL